MKSKITIVLTAMTGFVRPQLEEVLYPVEMAKTISGRPVLANATDAYTFESEDPRALWQQSLMLGKLLNSKFPNATMAWDYLTQYGCYCHQQGEKMPTSKLGYHGPALDELDELCKKSFRAQKCLKNEFEKEFDTSDSTSLKYFWYLDSTTNEIVCNNEKFPTWADEKSNQFRVQNCEIQKEFVLEVIDLIENQGYEKKSAYQKLGNNNKYEKVCKSDGFTVGINI